jgi:hypothetical protein
MNNLLQSSKNFIKRNGSTILTCVGSIGVVATTVMAVKATPKAVRLLEEAEAQKEETLTTFEKVKVAAPVYIPTILLGVSTIACVFGANALNKRQQASLLSAYALLNNSYKEYKKKVTELYGEDADANVRTELAKDAYAESDIEYEDNKLLFYDEYRQEYFNATMEDVLTAEYVLNRDLSCHEYVTLNEFYDLLKLPRTDFGEILGWASFTVYEHQWYSWIEFNHRKVELEDGMECYILEIITEPIPNFEEDY